MDTKPLLEPTAGPHENPQSGPLASEIPSSKTADSRTSHDDQHFSSVYGSFSRSTPEDIKPSHLQLHPYEEASACAAVSMPSHSHMKAPSVHARGMHTDMRYSPYSRQPYPMSSVAPAYLPHSHGHLYNYPSCNGAQSFPSTQAGYGFPSCVSVPTVVPTSSDLGSLEVTGGPTDQPDNLETRLH